MTVTTAASHSQLASKAISISIKNKKMKHRKKGHRTTKNTQKKRVNYQQSWNTFGIEKNRRIINDNSSLNMFNKIGILVKVNRVNVNNRHFATETCNEELLPIYDSVSRRDNIDLLRMYWGYQILCMFEKGESGANTNYLNDLFQLVTHYVCTWEYRECIANNDGKDFGIVVHFDEFEKIASIDLVDYEEWLVMLDSEKSKADSRQFRA